MTPNFKLAETTTPDGGQLILYEHGGSFCIRINGRQLVCSAATASELFLGEVAVERIGNLTDPRILIGGLGLGFTLRTVLERVGPFARVQVAELIPQVVAWNRQFMVHLNGCLLDDPRVELFIGDVWDLLTEAGPPCYDALLLDVDNGPRALVQKRNSRLYSREGLNRIGLKVKNGGRAVFWSADQVPIFAKRLANAGFHVTAIPARLYASAERSDGMIYVGDKEHEPSFN